MRRGNWLVFLVSVSLVVNILLAFNLSSSMRLVEQAKISAGNSFANHLLHFLYYGQLKMVGSEQHNPDEDKRAFIASLRILGDIDFPPAVELEQSIGGRNNSVNELSTSEGDEFILQLAIMYPLTKAYSNTRLHQKNRFSLLEAITEFKNIYIEAIGKLNEYHTSQRNFRGINYTVTTYDGKTIHKGNTDELLSEQKRVELINIMREISTDKEGIDEAISIINFEL